jgi:hypothetical protein
MSLYIQPANQTHLWNTIHSHPKFQPHLRQYPPDKISAWFRSTIEGFYRNWGNRPMNEMELKQLNQNTVSYLYQSIVSLNSTNQPPRPPVIPVQPQPPVQATIQQQFQQHPSLPKPLPDFHGQHEFEQRAQEYQAMNAKPAAAPLQGKTDADQRESQETMERRWLEQQRLREKDMEQFSPPSQVNGPQAINLNLLKSTSPDIMIQEPKEEKESIQLKIRELSEMKEREKPTTVFAEKEPIKEPIKENEPEWLKRIEYIEQLQEKMAVQIEQIFQRLLSTTPPQVENTKDNKIGDIDD